MNRFALISAALCASLLLSRCGDDCGDFNIQSPVGISTINTNTQALWSTEPNANIDSFGIFMRVSFQFAQQGTTRWSLIPTAYACSPPEPFYDATQYIDSIRVFAQPTYNGNTEITSLLRFEQTTNLTDYNNFTDRRILNGEGSGYFFLKEKPSESDEYSFGFYYYKGGEVIDSSFTQKYYISE